MALTEIEYGALASSKVMNDNFQYLDDRIGTLSQSVTTNQAGINSNITSINNSISTMSEEINTDIQNINTTLNQTISKFSENGMFVSLYINGSSWYKEYFSDEKKETRVWIEQGGICASRSTTTFLKEFESENYTLTLGTHCTYFEHGGISGKDKTGFSHYDGKGWSYNVEWYTCGK